MSDNSEKVVIITGAAGGIGRAYVRGFAGEGWNIVLADREDAGTVAEEASAAGAAGALAVAVDIADGEQCEAMAADAIGRFGRIDALVNNAAYFTAIRKQPFDQITAQEWDHCFAVNVRGTWQCCKAVIPEMRRRGGGKIVNTASMTVPSGIPGFLHYVSSKAAIVGLTRALAREVGADGIAVNTISPDYIPHDEEYAAQQPEAAAILRRQRCFDRDSVPEDLVGTVLHLTGEGSAFVTGQDFYVNGGRLFN